LKPPFHPPSLPPLNWTVNQVGVVSPLYISLGGNRKSVLLYNTVPCKENSIQVSHGKKEKKKRKKKKKKGRKE
jgi:hypothetical protein